MLSSAPPRVRAGEGAGTYVLLVDDHAPCLELLRMVLESVGHECVPTPSATEALAYCDTRRPALVVTDLRMPRIDGPGLARWVQARYPTTPIVLVTAERLEGANLSHLRRTFAAVFPKPLDIGAFLDVVESLIPPPTGVPGETA